MAQLPYMPKPVPPPRPSMPQQQMPPAKPKQPSKSEEKEIQRLTAPDYWPPGMGPKPKGEEPKHHRSHQRSTAEHRNPPREWGKKHRQFR